MYLPRHTFTVDFFFFVPSISVANNYTSRRSVKVDGQERKISVEAQKENNKEKQVSFSSEGQFNQHGKSVFL